MMEIDGDSAVQLCGLSALLLFYAEAKGKRVSRTVGFGV